MGAYLSSPVKSKLSESGESEKLLYGATAMQGWRVNQEDAHNCILDYGENCSYFAVYDGHGGAEVSEYASKTFPDYIKSTEMWSKGRFGQALEEAFFKIRRNFNYSRNNGRA
jgi:protein phosphatase 1G